MIAVGNAKKHLSYHRSFFFYGRHVCRAQTKTLTPATEYIHCTTHSNICFDDNGRAQISVTAKQRSPQLSSIVGTKNHHESFHDQNEKVPITHDLDTVHVQGRCTINCLSHKERTKMMVTICACAVNGTYMQLRHSCWTPHIYSVTYIGLGGGVSHYPTTVLTIYFNTRVKADSAPRVRWKYWLDHLVTVLMVPNHTNWLLPLQQIFTLTRQYQNKYSGKEQLLR